jgi:Helix-turn-helix domain.
MKTAYKFRMYPNRQQEAQLDLNLETCRHLYNLALADRKYSYETEGISRTYEDQAAMLVVEKKDRQLHLRLFPSTSRCSSQAG